MADSTLPAAREGKRKIIQVATDSTAVIALCDDGSVWSLPEDGDGKWKRLPSIPQDE
jgi:hypothetical protein